LIGPDLALITEGMRTSRRLVAALLVIAAQALSKQRQVATPAGEGSADARLAPADRPVVPLPGCAAEHGPVAPQRR